MSTTAARVWPRWPVLLVALFCAYSLLLLWNAFQSQYQLRRAADARLVADSKRRAAALGDFASHRRSEAEELAGLHEIQTYLANRSLGMSPLYGLDASLEAVELRLRSRVNGPKRSGTKALTRALYVGADGLPLADTSAPGSSLPALTTGTTMLALDVAAGQVVVSTPVRYKGEDCGTLVTVSDMADLQGSLVRLETLGSYRETLLGADGHDLLAPQRELARAAQLASLPANQATELSGRGEDSVAVMTPVPGLPAVLVTTLSRGEIYGQLSSPWTLASLGAFPLLLLAAALRMAHLSQRADALLLDAAQNDVQRLLLQQRNEGQALEIQRRQAVEAELQAHRDQLKETLAQRTGELNRLFHALPDLYFRTDRDGSILEHRAGRGADLLLAPEHFLGRRMQDVLPPHVAMLVDNALAELARGADQAVFEYSLAMPSGLQTYEARLLPLGQDQCVVVVRNVTERSENDALREANRVEAERLVRVKSEFLANMSHEIRTPLNAVLGLAQLGGRGDDLAAARAGFQRIEEAGRHLLGIIDDILDLSKLEAGKLSVDQQPFRLATVVDNALSLVAGRTAIKGLELRRDLAAGLPEWVLGDALRVKQVLVNLLSNAVKFTSRGDVSLAVSGADGWLSFAVADTGIGMDNAQLARLFQPFEQADNSITRRFGGTGLGLVISRNLAGLMGGTLDVASQPGHGTIFTLRLPLPAAAPIAALPATGMSSQRLTGLRLLAAEDVEVNRLVLQGQLEFEGARVVFAEDGRAAVAAVAASLLPGAPVFDAVLMDVQMPVMDGLEATRQIHALRPGLPVIGLTAHALNDERDRCLAAGMVERVVKPADLDLLVAAVQRHVSRTMAA